MKHNRYSLVILRDQTIINSDGSKCSEKDLSRASEKPHLLTSRIIQAVMQSVEIKNI